MSTPPTAPLDQVQITTEHPHLQHQDCSETCSGGRSPVAFQGTSLKTAITNPGIANPVVVEHYNINPSHQSMNLISEERRAMESSRNYSAINASMDMTHMKPDHAEMLHGAGAAFSYQNNSFAPFSDLQSRVLLSPNRKQERFTYSSAGHNIPSSMIASLSPVPCTSSSRPYTQFHQQQLRTADQQQPYSIGEFSNRVANLEGTCNSGGEEISGNFQASNYRNSPSNIRTVEATNNQSVTNHWTRPDQTAESRRFIFSHDVLTNGEQHHDGNPPNWLQHYFTRLKSMDGPTLPAATKGQYLLPLQRPNQDTKKYPEMLLRSSSQRGVEGLQYTNTHDGNEIQVNQNMLPDQASTYTASCDFNQFRDSPLSPASQRNNHPSLAKLSNGICSDQILETKAALYKPDSEYCLGSPSKHLQSRDQGVVYPTLNYMSGYNVSEESTVVEVLSSAGEEKPPVFDAAELLVFASDEFRMYEFKVRGCMRDANHDWTQCPFAHPGEKARRRDPRLYQYSATPCPDYRRSQSYNCRRGDACEFSHGVFESWLHPARYRTQMCKDGLLCKREVCFFAHTPSQLRALIISDSSTVLEASQSRKTSERRSNNVGLLKSKRINTEIAPSADRSSVSGLLGYPDRGLAAHLQINEFGQILLPVPDVRNDMIEAIQGRQAAFMPTGHQLIQLPHNYAGINDYNAMAADAAVFDQRTPVGREGVKFVKQVIAPSPSLFSKHIKQLESDPLATDRLPSFNSRCMLPVSKLPAMAERVEAVENPDVTRESFKSFSVITEDNSDARAVLAMYPLISPRNVTVDDYQLPPFSNMVALGDQYYPTPGYHHRLSPNLHSTIKYDRSSSLKTPNLRYLSTPSAHSPVINLNEGYPGNYTAANQDSIISISGPEHMSSTQYGHGQPEQKNTPTIPPSCFQPAVIRPHLLAELQKLNDCLDAYRNITQSCNEQVQQQMPQRIWAGVPRAAADQLNNITNPVDAFNPNPYTWRNNSSTVLQSGTDEMGDRQYTTSSCVQVATINNDHSENNVEQSSYDEAAVNGH